MKIYSSPSKVVKFRFLMILMVTIVITSCKNSSGSDSSFFSFDSSDIEELGSPESINEELTAFEAGQLYSKDTIMAFYEGRANRPAWNDPDLREELLNSLKEAEDEGLYFQDYHGEELVDKMERLNDLDENELSKLDILMTDAFLKFGDHLLHGKTDPKKLHEVFDVPEREMDKPGLLEKAIEENDLQVAIRQLRPDHLVYQQLIDASREYKKLKENFKGFENIPGGETVELGEEDERLPLIQSRLKFFGYLDNVDSTNTKNNEKVNEALINFQRDNGIEADGIIGNGTIKMLNKGYDERYNQILVNLERWRWYPKELGDHYIVVNIANYELVVVKDNDTVRSHKTMVGTEARKTPIFSEEVEHIVLNPDWTIPPTIQNKDVIPGMKKNKNYLASKNINIYDQSGNRVDPSSVNWNGEEAKSYTYRQNPGATNPLGRVKIIYPNEYLIYLHDTPSQDLFERDSRAESSGCVRVQDAVGLAKYLLSDQDEYTSEKVDEIIEKGELKQIQMNQKVKVYHFYWTAWRDNGKTRFTEDIYGYDDKIFEALQKAS